MLRNMTERKAFVQDYRSWGVYIEIPELTMRVFRKELPDGSIIYACEYKTSYYTHSVNPYGDDEWWPAQYQLVEKGERFKPTWDSITSIIEHMSSTRRKWPTRIYGSLK